MKIRLALYFSLAVIAAMVVYVDHELDRKVAVPEEGRLFRIEKGSSLNSVISDLTAADILQTHPAVIRAYGLAIRFMGTVKAGEYRIMPDMSLRDVLMLFRSGKVVQRQIRFVEGWRFEEWRQHLAGNEHIRHTIDEETGRDIMKMLGIQMDEHPMHPEGQFYPDTYQFTSGETDLSILKRAYDRMQRVLHEEWQRRNLGGVLDSPYEALIIASIVERETGYQPDRGRIARVFINRLEKNMRLQSDPTVIYGLGDQYDGDLVRSHLKHDSPYNTYRHRGLPPTPISNPGRPSIRATMQPEPGDYLYFVGRGDGTSQFSSTLAEHNEAVTRYQKAGRVEQYRSVPEVDQ